MQELIYIALIILLVKIANIDLKLKIIPDSMNFMIALLGIFNLILNYETSKIYIISTVITFAGFLLLAMLTEGGIGGGDIKLFTALGLVFGAKIMLVIAATFTIAAIILIPKAVLKLIDINESIALAPYICVGAIICFIKIYIP